MMIQVFGDNKLDNISKKDFFRNVIKNLVTVSVNLDKVGSVMLFSEICTNSGYLRSPKVSLK
jgi:hypothetical protein